MIMTNRTFFLRLWIAQIFLGVLLIKIPLQQGYHINYIGTKTLKHQPYFNLLSQRSCDSLSKSLRVVPIANAEDNRVKHLMFDCNYCYSSLRLLYYLQNCP